MSPPAMKEVKDNKNAYKRHLRTCFHDCFNVYNILIDGEVVTTFQAGDVLRRV